MLGIKLTESAEVVVSLGNIPRFLVRPFEEDLHSLVEATSFGRGKRQSAVPFFGCSITDV